MSVNRATVALVVANNGLRVMEQRQLRWSDLQRERLKVKAQERTLVRIYVRNEKAKVLANGSLLCRNGQYLERLCEIAKAKSIDELVVTVDDESGSSNRILHY